MFVLDLGVPGGLAIEEELVYMVRVARGVRVGAPVDDGHQFQLVDLPAVSSEYMEPWVTDVIRISDAALWVIDAADAARESKVNEVVELLARKKIELVNRHGMNRPKHDPVRQVRTLVVAKGRNLKRVDLKSDRPDDDALAALLLGPTGNLRAPTLKSGRTMLVGFSADAYADLVG